MIPSSAPRDHSGAASSAKLAAVGIVPILILLTAAGLAVIVVPTALARTRHRGLAAIAFNAVLFLAAVVARGRSGSYAR